MWVEIQKSLSRHREIQQKASEILKDTKLVYVLTLFNNFLCGKKHMGVGGNTFRELQHNSCNTIS